MRMDRTLVIATLRTKSASPINTRSSLKLLRAKSQPSQRRPPRLQRLLSQRRLPRLQSRSQLLPRLQSQLSRSRSQRRL